MQGVADLLDPVVQRALRDVLEGDRDLAQYQKILEPETLAAMAIVGGHPDHLQDLAAAIMPTAARAQLDAYQLLDREDSGERVQWSLTEDGRRLAAALARAVEPPSRDRRVEAEEELRKLIDAGNAEFETSG